MTPEPWLEAHSYLRPVADLLDAHIPDWDDDRAAFLAGVPLLSSAEAAVDLEPGGRMAAAGIARHAALCPRWPSWSAPTLGGLHSISTSSLTIVD